MAHRPHRHSGLSKDQKERALDRGNETNVEQNPGIPHDFAKVGPRSIEGVEASDLPDKGRGPIETNPGKELRRKLPQSTGAIGEGTDVGIRAEPDIADAQDHGNRKHN